MTRVGLQERNCSDSQAHLFCTTPCSLHRSCFTLTLKESPWNIPQWVPVKFPVLTKEILLSLCTPLLGSQQAALLCPLVSSLHTAHLQFFPFSTLVGLCGFILDPVCLSCSVCCTWGWSQGKARGASALDTPSSPSLQSQEKQLFLQQLLLLFSCWLIILWVKAEVNYLTGDLCIFIAIHLAPGNHPSSTDLF